MSKIYFAENVVAFGKGRRLKFLMIQLFGKMDFLRRGQNESSLRSNLNIDLCAVWPVAKSRQMSIKSCPKMIPLEKWKILTPLQKLPKNVGDLGKITAATGFEKLLKMQ